MPNIEDIWGAAAVLLGIVLFLWKNKRRFDRTNAAGIEQFSSYGGKVVVRLLESILWGFAFISLTAGALVLAYEHESTWGWIVLAPMYGLILLVMLFGFGRGRSK